MSLHNSKEPRSTILFIEQFGSLVGGGQFSVLSLLTKLRGAGHTIVVTVPEKGNFYDALKEKGFTPALVDVNTFKGLRICKLPIAIFKLNRIIKKNQVKIVHGNAARAVLVGGFACLGTKASLIWHLRIPGKEPLYDFVLTKLSKRIVAISHHVAKRIKRDRDKIMVVHNGVEPAPEINRNAIEKLHSRFCINGELVVGTVGQLVPSKGIDDFIKTGAIVLKEVPETKLLIVGKEMPKMAKGYVAFLKSLCKELSIEDRVIFTGFQRDVYSLYALMHVFAFFTKLEAFGRVVAEAMMASKPVVCTRVGGIPEIVDEGKCGYLFPVNNREYAAEKIITLLKNENLREEMGAAGKQRAETHFSALHNAEQIDKVYNELLHHK